MKKVFNKWIIIFTILIIVGIGLFIGIIYLIKPKLNAYEITFISCEFNEERQLPKLRVSYLDDECEQQYVEKYKLTELEKYIISLGIDENFNCGAYEVFIVVETNRFAQFFNTSARILNWYLAID